jgi:gluconolactonase
MHARRGFSRMALPPNMKRFLPFLLLPLAALAADYPAIGTIERTDPALDALIPKDAKIEKLAEGFTWSEGPVWKEGALLFSDVPANIVYRWKPGATNAEVFLQPSGLLTPKQGFREQGSNGLGLDHQGRLILCQHGERRLARVEPDGKQTALIDRFEGQQFNSPNDLAIRRNRDIYFTDPPYGLEGTDKSPLKELDFHGIYRLDPAGKLTLLTKEIAFPNGIAFSPDEKTLYVGVSAPKTTRVVAFAVQPDGTLGAGRTFFDAAPLQEAGVKGACDGLKLDTHGNIYASAPGGVVVLSPAGKTLGWIKTGDLIANCGWGDDGSTLYLTANHWLCRVKTTTKGDKFPAK